jgi:hypothetical protein
VIAVQESMCGQRLSEPVSKRRDLSPVLRVSPLSYFPRILASGPQGVFSHMSIPFLQGKLQGEERKKVLQAVQEQAKVAACAAVKLALEAFLEAEVSVKLGREKGEARRMNGQERPIDWQCGHCGCSDANQFTRDGHYHRGLSTGWGQSARSAHAHAGMPTVSA